MSAYFKFEWQQFTTNKKNIAIFLIALTFAGYYVLSLGANYQPKEQINERELKATTLSRREFVDTTSIADDLSGNLTYAVNVFEEYLKIDEPRLVALSTNNLKEYTKLTAEWYDLSNYLIPTSPEGFLYYNSAYFTYGEFYPMEDAFYGYEMTGKRYAGYLKEKIPITRNILEERTAFQHLQRLFETFLPYLLLLSMLFLSVDLITKDRHHQSLLLGFPISSGQKLVVKYLISLLGLSLVMTLTLSIIFIGIGWQFGFGLANLPVPINSEQFLPIWQLLCQNISLLLLQGTIIFWSLALLSLIFNNEFLNLLIGVAYLFTEKLYYGRGKGFFIDYSHYPSSYIRTGKIVNGFDNYYYASKDGLYHYQQGLITLGLTSLILMTVTLLWTKSRKFHSI